MENELKYSEHPFVNYSVQEIQDMIRNDVIPSGLAFFKDDEAFEYAMKKVEGKRLKFAIFDFVRNQVRIFKTYIDEVSSSNMGCRIIFDKHPHQPFDEMSDSGEIQRFKEFLKGHHLSDLADSQIFISALSPMRLGSPYLDLRHHLFLLAENFDQREVPETLEPSEPFGDDECPIEKRFFLVGQTLYSHLDYLDQTSAEVIAIQNETTGIMELHELGIMDNAVFIGDEVIRTIKNL